MCRTERLLHATKACKPFQYCRQCRLSVYNYHKQLVCQRPYVRKHTSRILDKNALIAGCKFAERHLIEDVLSYDDCKKEE